MRNWKPLVLVCVVSILVLSAQPSTRGSIAAWVAVRRGNVRVLGIGLQTDSLPEYISVLRQRYNIEYRTVAGCAVSKSLLDYVQSYNEISMNAAKRKWGDDMFRRSAKEARIIWERAHSQR